MDGLLLRRRRGGLALLLVVPFAGGKDANQRDQIDGANDGSLNRVACRGAVGGRTEADEGHDEADPGAEQGLIQASSHKLGFDGPSVGGLIAGHFNDGLDEVRRYFGELGKHFRRRQRTGSADLYRLLMNGNGSGGRWGRRLRRERLLAHLAIGLGGVNKILANGLPIASHRIAVGLPRVSRKTWKSPAVELAANVEGPRHSRPDVRDGNPDAAKNHIPMLAPIGRPCKEAA